jgi:hypothetical protein
MNPSAPQEGHIEFCDLVRKKITIEKNFCRVEGTRQKLRKSGEEI